MWRIKFGTWAVAWMLAALSLGSCSDSEDEPAFVPPSNITVALKQLYPAVEDITWEMKDVYYVADCRVAGSELEVWFDRNANWLMTENELESVDSLVPAVYTAFVNSKYSSWSVTEVYVLSYPQQPMESAVEVKQGDRRYLLIFSQDGALLHEKDVSNGDDTIWPPALSWT